MSHHVVYFVEFQGKMATSNAAINTGGMSYRGMYVEREHKNAFMGEKVYCGYK